MLARTTGSESPRPVSGGQGWPYVTLRYVTLRRRQMLLRLPIVCSFFPRPMPEGQKHNAQTRHGRTNFHSHKLLYSSTHPSQLAHTHTSQLALTSPRTWHQPSPHPPPLPTDSRLEINQGLPKLIGWVELDPDFLDSPEGVSVVVWL